MKEKRDAPMNTAAYSYEAPQKSHLVSIQEQHQKAAQIEYQQATQKVAPLNQYEQKQQQAPAQVQAQQQFYEVPQQQQHQQYEAAPQQQYEQISLEQFEQLPHNYEQPTHYASLAYPSASQAYFASEPYKGFGGDSYKGFADFTYSFPGFESFHQMPLIHYNPEFNKINSALIDVPDLKSSSLANFKFPSFHEGFSYASPSTAAAYSLPLQSYAYPHQQHAYVSNYVSAPSAPAAPSAHYTYSQPPSAIFVPNTVSVASKAPAKVPDYAQGTKGLGHYSTHSSLAAQAPAPTQAAYVKQTYQAPSYAHFTQTERPFRPSAYLGSTHIGQDPNSEQSISNNVKPTGEYLPPAKNYLPSKEQYVPQQSPVEYQVHYVQAPTKAYVQPTANSYLPPKSVQIQESPKSSYLPPKTSYVPAKSSHLPPKSSYLPPAQPTNNYLPPNNPYQSNYQFGAHSSPSAYQQYQQQPQSSYESVEYQSVTPSGHK